MPSSTSKCQMQLLNRASSGGVLGREVARGRYTIVKKVNPTKTVNNVDNRRDKDDNGCRVPEVLFG